MSGPPYPIQVLTFDWWKTVVSQYANSPILTSILESFFDCLDQNADFDRFYNLIWNINTAQGYGLDVWGRIVNVSRVLAVPGSIVYLDFEEAGGAGVFGVGAFYAGESVTDNFSLSDDAFRTLILAKALANICDGSIKAINNLLLVLFPDRGNAWVADNNDMTMTYKFAFQLTDAELAIVQNSGALPKPAGVSMSVVSPA